MSIVAKLRRKKKRPCWTRSWIMRRDELSISSTQVIGGEGYGAEYRAIFRINEIEFDYLLNIASPATTKQNTLLRTFISARERWEITLRYLATGRPKLFGKP